MVRMREIAKACGVSKSTVSLAINKPHKISKDQKEKILKAARDMGYFLKKSTALDQVLIVCKDLKVIYSDPYYSEVLAKLIFLLQQERITLDFLEELNVEYSEIYQNKGIIFLGDASNQSIDLAKSFRIPFVLCGHPTHRKDVYSVRFDIAAGIYELLAYIQSCGHKQVGLVLGKFEKEPYINEIIKQTFQKATGLSAQKLEKCIAYADYRDIQAMETALLNLLESKPRPTAIMFADDVLAYFSYNIFKKNKLRLPEDVSITGFDGIAVPQYFGTPAPYLTTIYSDRALLAEQSLAVLKQVLADPEYQPRETKLPINLRIGDSVKRLK